MASVRLRLAVMLWSSALSVTAAANRPVIEYIEPTSGPTGTVVEIVGRGLGSASRVRVGAVELTVVEVMPSRVRARLPEGTTTGSIVVDTPGGVVQGPEFRVTAPRPAPRIDSFEPKRGPPGSHVTLRGQNFSPRLTGNVVTLAGERVLVHSATPVTLDVIVPQVTSGGPFQVRVAEGGEAVSGQSFEVTQGAAITSVEPARAPPGAELTVKGSGFSATPGATRVYLNNVELEIVRATPTEVVVRLAQRIATGDILVDVAGAGQVRSPHPFVPQWPPTVVGFAPRQGAPGTLVTVRGTNFGDDPAAVLARMGEAELAVREAQRTRLVVEIPAGAQSERLSIRVHGVGPAWSPVAFRVLSSLAITGVTPQGGPAGTVAVIEGQGFDPTPQRNRVTVGGRSAEVIDATGSRIEFRVPAGGSGPVEVELPGGERARARDPFVVTQPPDLGSALPREGTVGTDIAIRGKGFGSSPALVHVTLGGHPLEVRSVRDDFLVVRITPGATTGKLRVQVRLQGASELEGEVRVLSSLAVTDVDPARAPVGGVVTVRGMGFVANGTLVEFGGVAASPEAVEADRIRVAVPEGARSGILVVRLPDGRNSPGPRPFSVGVPD